VKIEDQCHLVTLSRSNHFPTFNCAILDRCWESIVSKMGQNLIAIRLNKEFLNYLLVKTWLFRQPCMRFCIAFDLVLSNMTKTTKTLNLYFYYYPSGPKPLSHINKSNKIKKYIQYIYFIRGKRKCIFLCIVFLQSSNKLGIKVKGRFHGRFLRPLSRPRWAKIQMDPLFHPWLCLYHFQ
jgi:hypothetical protein